MSNETRDELISKLAKRIAQDTYDTNVEDIKVLESINDKTYTTEQQQHFMSINYTNMNLFGDISTKLYTQSSSHYKELSHNHPTIKDK